MKTLSLRSLALVATLVCGTAAPVLAADAVVPPRNSWSFAGPFGKFDRAQIQRGFQVYKEVCAACHSLEKVAFRNLSQPGGPEIPADQVAEIAKTWTLQVKELNDAGEYVDRPARPSDIIPKPFANKKLAEAANGGKAPPDLSLMAKARTYERGFPWFLIDIVTQFQEQGPDYIKAFLTGYTDAPKDHPVPEGTNYNTYYPGNAVAMPNVLSDGLVTYQDGTAGTVKNYATDVTAFLMWTAEPHLEARKRIGFQVMLFLLCFAIVLYFTKKKIWADAH